MHTRLPSPSGKFFLRSSDRNLTLYSFPTRRSSDLLADYRHAVFRLRVVDRMPAQHERASGAGHVGAPPQHFTQQFVGERSEEHTSELRSHSDLVCRLLLEKKKNMHKHLPTRTDKTC